MKPGITIGLGFVILIILGVSKVAWPASPASVVESPAPTVGSSSPAVESPAPTVGSSAQVGENPVPAAGNSVSTGVSQPIQIGENYILNSDINFGGTGFIIVADDITLDLNGHTINGPGPLPSSSLGVQISSHKGVTVKNGTITGFGCGVLLDGSNNNTVRNINCARTNIGVLVRDSTLNSLVDNVITDSTNSGIILMDNSDNNLVINCSSRNNVSGGIWVNNGSDGNVIDGCTLTGNSFAGVFFGGGASQAGLSAPSNNNTVRNSNVSNNQNSGVFVINSDSNRIADNKVEKNAKGGIFVTGSPPNPRYPAPSTANNVISGNELNDNSGSDINDTTSGTGTAGTANIYENNTGKTSHPEGLVN